MPEIFDLVKFGSQFQTFQPMVTWSCCFGLVAQYSMAGMCGKEPVHLRHLGNKETDREGLGSQNPLQGHASSDLISSH
jgi:hypothetical protein